MVNRLSVPIDVIYIRGDNRIPIIDDLKPGLSYEINDFVTPGKCVNESMIAMDQSGTVLATFPGPVCDGTDWEVSGRTIDLVAADTDNRLPIPVRVVDESHRLVDARSASQADLAAFMERPMEGAAIGVTQAGSDRHVLLIWNGSGCDLNASILVAKDVSALTVDSRTPETCPLSGTYRGVVLVFDGPVVVDQIRLEAP